MNAKLTRFLPVLRSPRSASPLLLSGDELVASGYPEERYSFVGPSAMLVAAPTQQNLEPPPAEIISQNSTHFTPPSDYGDDALVLHLGCGAVESLAANTLSIDVLPLPNVDIVAAVDCLPFVDGCVDYVVSSAVFEHVRDPIRAIDEVKRVLKPGGTFYIDTAFMQSYHGFPAHYFNLTPLAAEAYLGGAFELLHSGVTEDASELVALQSLLGRFASYLEPGLRERFESRTIGGFLAEVARDHSFSHPLLQGASEYSRRAMGAAVRIIARKPAAYDPSLERRPELFAYYEARMGVLFRQHELDLFRRFAASLGADLSDAGAPQIGAQEILVGCLEEHSIAGYAAATERLREGEKRLIEARNPYITAYLQALERATAAPTAAQEEQEALAPERPIVLETDTIRLRKGRYGFTLFKRRDDTIGRAVDLYGEWAQAECDLLDGYLSAGDVVLDIGANIGTHTLFFSHAVGSAGRVLSFEPQHEIFAIAAANVALNERTNVTLHRSGIGEQMGWMMPTRTAGAMDNFGAVTLAAIAPGDDSWSRTPIATIDSLELGRCDLMKIDVEGMEIDVLRGAERTVARHRPIVYAENTDPARSLAVCAWLMERNYRIFWHPAAAFNPQNVAGERENIFGGATELNVLCLPAERRGLPLPELAESREPSEFAPALMARAR